MHRALLRISCIVRTLILAVLLAMPGPYARADVATDVIPPSPAAETTAQDPLGRGTPRGMVNGLISALGRDDFARAAEFLDLSGLDDVSRNTRSLVLAEGLRALLDRRGALLASYQLSSSPTGFEDDGLAPGIDVIAALRIDGAMVPLTAHYVSSQNGPPVWLLTPQSVDTIAGLYWRPDTSLIERWTPLWIQGKALRGAPVAHWLALGMTAALTLGAGWAMTYLLHLILSWRIARLRGAGARLVANRILLPVGLLIAASLFNTVTAFLGVSIVARAAVGPFVEIVLWFSVGWLLWRGSDAAVRASLPLLVRRRGRNVVAMAQLARRILKFAIFALTLAAVLNSLGFNLTGWLAAFGLGGLAIALGAQKTIEHFVGSLTLIADNPISVGDYCSVDGVTGTVEDIGMRSTRLRTLERTVITIPNGTMSQAMIENFGRRDTFRYNPTLELGFDTTADQMRDIVVQLRSMLEADPRVVEGSAMARFSGFSRRGFSIDLWALIRADDYTASLGVNETLNFQIMEIVTQCGAYFARSPHVKCF